MEPTPETVAAVTELARFDADVDLMGELIGLSERVRAVVPTCVGMSVGVVDYGLTFTLVATRAEWAQLDAVQYLDGGPCVRAAEREQTVSFGRDDVLGEEAWVMYARATAAAGVASSLSMPVRTGERVTGGVNLYASTVDAFTGHEEELAEVLGAWAPGVVANADLSFSTRLEAVRALGRIEERDTIDRATGVLAASQHTDVDTARERLRQAAARAGLSEAEVAAAVLELRNR